MKLHTVLIENEPISGIYTSLAHLCADYSLPYSSIAHGKRSFIKDGKSHRILSYDLIKIKGRGRNDIKRR